MVLGFCFRFFGNFGVVHICFVILFLHDGCVGFKCGGSFCKLRCGSTFHGEVNFYVRSSRMVQYWVLVFLDF